MVPAPAFGAVTSRDDLSRFGAIAQLGERLLCKQEVVGSIPSGSTRGVVARPIQIALGRDRSKVCVRNGGSALSPGERRGRGYLTS